MGVCVVKGPCPRGGRQSLPIPKPPPYRLSSESPHRLHHIPFIPRRPCYVQPPSYPCLQFLPPKPPCLLLPLRVPPLIAHVYCIRPYITTRRRGSPERTERSHYDQERATERDDRRSTPMRKVGRRKTRDASVNDALAAFLGQEDFGRIRRVCVSVEYYALLSP